MAHRSPPPPPSHRHHPSRPLLGPVNGLHPSLSSNGLDRAPPMNGGPSSNLPRANSLASAPGLPPSAPYPSNSAPPPLSVGGAAGPPQQGPSVLQILAIGQERNHAADSMAHHPRIESLVKLGKESEATWLQIGATAESLGDLDRAVASYESALRHNAYSVVALSQIAAICRSKEEFKKAAEYFGRVVGIAPESGDVWGALGHCYLMIDDLKKAYSSYQQALYYMLNPQEPKLWYGIGILYDRYGSLEHAEEAFSSVIRMDPSFEKANEIFFRLGIIYKQQRKSAQSLECFRYILQNPPRPLTEIDIWFQIGHVYEQQKDFIAAKESYERVLAENPAHAKVLQQLGGLYHRSRAPFYNPEASVTILTKSLESDANDPFSWYLLGRAYMTTNNFGKAYEAYQQAVYRDGKNPAFWCSIGVLYFNINQFHDALDAYSRAIRIHPYLAEVWFNLGALYESCNDQMTDAIDAYQRTLQLDPSNAIVGTRLREIREHQSTGAALSAPPTPKDISPSSLSWNYATNAGGAPAYLAQSGLGPELSPALSRPGGHSPPNGHGFDGPPAQLGRPQSSNSYRGSDERRRSSAAHQQHSPTASMDHSPRSSTHRLSGPSQALLPQIKSLHEARGSPTIPPASEIQRLHSPPSPRTRHSDLEHNYPPQPSYRHPPPPQLLPPYARGGPLPMESAERGNGMEWERSGRMGSANGRGSAASQRPGSSQSRGDSVASPFAHERHAPSPSSSRPSIFDDRDPRDPRGGPLSPYPSSAYAYGGHYPRPSPQPSYEPPRRFDPREREREYAEEDRRRGGSMARGESSPRLAPNVAEASGSGKAREVSRSPATVPASTPSVLAGKKESNATITGQATKSRKKDSSGETVTGKRDRKASSSVTKSKDEAPAKKSRSSNGASTTRFVAESPSTHSSPANSPLPIPATIAPQLPSRTVDEDYDEGVDALMELATTASSHEQSPPIPPTIVSANLPPLPPVEPPVVEKPASPETKVEEDDSNSRKRSLESPGEGSNKRSKSVVAEVIPEVVEEKVVKEEAVVEEQEDGEVQEVVA